MKKKDTEHRNVSRQTVTQDPRNPVDKLDTGYFEEPSLDFTIPPCGIEDVDDAVFRLFNEDLGLVVKEKENVTTRKFVEKKPFVVYAGGEKFAVAKKLKPMRDRQGTIILPAIAIRRTNLTQEYDDIRRRGINATTGNLIIKRRLASEDRNYQNLINKLGIDNVLKNYSTSRKQGSYDENQYVGTREGGMLEPHLGNNIWEFISIPQPQFFTAQYEITIWTSYIQSMNKIIEKIWSSYLPQKKTFLLVSPKGYWFMGDMGDTQTDNNFDDYVDTERLIRYTFTLTVKGYLLAPQGDTDMVPVRRWLSSPNIAFDVSEYNGHLVSKEMKGKLNNKITGEMFTLTDIQEDPYNSITKTTSENIVTWKFYEKPDARGRKGKYVQFLEPNEKRGETIYRASDAKTLEEFLNK